jgi:CelD/BcsL family acetyltransferase involved in cellulose biosynthesis
LLELMPRVTANSFTSAHRALAEPCTFEMVTSRDAFVALEADWNALFDRAGQGLQLFQTFNWLWHWSNHFLDDTDGTTKLAIVTARRDGRLVMVWPLVSEERGWLVQLGWMGYPVSQYGDVLIEEGPDRHDILCNAWRFMSKRTGADLISLRKVRADAAVTPILADLGGIVLETLGAPYLDLESAKSYEDYEQRYSKSSRKRRARDRRILNDRGTVAIASLVSGRDAAELTQAALHQKRAWLKDRALVSLALSDPRTDSFFADVAAAQSHSAGLRVLSMTAGNEQVAFEIGIVCKGRSAMHVNAYRPEFHKLSPGNLLLEHSIRQALQNGISVFDLLAPAEDYKMDWADGVVTIRDWAAPFTVSGHFYTRFYLGFLRRLLKMTFALLPAFLRRAVTKLVSQ